MMVPKIEVEKFLAQFPSSGIPLLDVRSPGEYSKGHIPGAVNFPLFEDEERARVGTLYKQESRESAMLAGLEIVGPKMAEFVRRAGQQSPDRRLFVHCWRGGMRSESVAQLLQMAGFNMTVLTGGYKAYRSYIRSQLSRKIPLLVVGGKTGSGKTDILHALEAAGEQILDLEGLAHHKGSTFGALGQPPQPSNEHFENKVYTAFSQHDPARRIWIEDESNSIGKVFVPSPLWEQMLSAPTIALEVPVKFRVGRLVREYATFSREELSAALLRIEKRLGGLRLKQAMQAFESGDYESATEIALAYYDKAYLFGMSQKPAHLVHHLPVSEDDPVETANQLIALADSLPVSIHFSR